MNASQQPAPSQTFDHIDYPTSFPTGCVIEMIRIAKGGTLTTETASFTAAAWNVMGYGFSIVPGRPPLVLNGKRVARDANPLTSTERSQLQELHDALEAACPSEPKAVGAAGPVGSDLSVFLKNIGLIGFVAAFKQFILDILNIKPAA